eukprot:c40791_g1_i1.p2 GENE.c40791_g1_i1~~c40791_g1_i1.p2  ORF type:complete len:226 (+),score=42.26 c40791_g1_i1:1-678(+)
MASNDCGTECGVTLSETLPLNNTLTTLRLEASGLTSDGVVALAPGLARNRTLLYLTVDGNSLDSAAVVAVAASLEGNHTLQSIDFGTYFDSEIGDDGARAVAQLLRVNSTLRALVLRRNHMTDAGVAAIADALEQSDNYAMCLLAVDSTFPSAARCEAVCKRNGLLGTGRWRPGWHADFPRWFRDAALAVMVCLHRERPDGIPPRVVRVMLSAVSAAFAMHPDCM